MRLTPFSSDRKLRGTGSLVGRSRSHGLGQWEAIIGTVASSMLGHEGGGTGAMPSVSSRNEVSPTIITGISPQISPVFQQQYQPTNSGLTASTSQGTPDAAMAALGVGNTSYPAGYPIAQPYASPAVYSAGAGVDQIVSGIDNTVLALAGLGAIWYMTKGKSHDTKRVKKHGKKERAT